MSEIRVEVKPLGRPEIRKLTRHIREITGVKNAKNYCVVDWFENRFCPLTSFNLDVCEKNEMGENHALTCHENKVVYIREDVYQRAYEGHGRDRATIIHEVGHAILHTPDRWLFARKFTNDNIPAYRHPEWQAKAFAGEFLVPVELLQVNMTASDVAQAFGVSLDSARYQIVQYEKEGLLKISGPAKADPLITWMR